MAYATWLADVLRGAGLQVVEHPGWRTRGNGDYTDLYAVVLHHDASPPGDSPGVPGYMIRNFNVAGAQCWVDRAGAWHLVAAGVAYHAGAVLPGMPGNRQSIGVETDHTTGEDWPPALLRSLRVGTAAVLAHLGSTPARGLHFHKTICSPRGRKVDPDRLDLTTERAAVAATIATSEEDDMPSPEELLNAPVPRYDAAGARAGETSLAQAAGHLDANLGRILDALSGLPSFITDVRGDLEIKGQQLATAIDAGDAATVAAQIPDDLAQQVVDALADRLNGA